MRVSSASSSLLGCSGALAQGCVTSQRGTLSTGTWQLETCWSTPTWSVKYLTLACPDSWEAWTTTYLHTLPHWYVSVNWASGTFKTRLLHCLSSPCRAVRFLWGGQLQKPFSIASSALLVMFGASAYLCGKWCHMESVHTGTWAIKKWVCVRVWPEYRKSYEECRRMKKNQVECIRTYLCKGPTFPLELKTRGSALYLDLYHDFKGSSLAPPTKFSWNPVILLILIRNTWTNKENKCNQNCNLFGRDTLKPFS